MKFAGRTRSKFLPALALAGIVALLGGGVASLRAEDAYYNLAVFESIGTADLPTPHARWHPSRAGAALPKLRSDTPVEAYFSLPDSPERRRDFQELRVHVRMKAGEPWSGEVLIPGRDGYVARPIRLDPADASPDHREAYELARYQYYVARFNEGGSGRAWFRHQAAKTRTFIPDEAARPLQGLRTTPSDFQRSYDLLTGGRALAENLQLDQVLEPESGSTGSASSKVLLREIEGVTVQPFDWAPLLAELEQKPRLDVLAKVIPVDQHVAFFPSYAAFDRICQEGERYGSLFAGLVETHSGDTKVLARYERQLCLSRDLLARVFAERMIRSMAITGSDPYLRTGSDVALLFETSNATALLSLIRARVSAAAAEPGATLLGESSETGLLFGVTTADRARSSFVARFGDHVVVTNSLAQLAQLRRTHLGALPNLETAPEYTFFRDRYRYAEDGVHALLVITDATLRRWVGPRWRIAASRRIRAAALLADLQAEHLGELRSGPVKSREIHTGQRLAGGGAIQLEATGVRSEVYGTLGFLTPIRELEFEAVSREENQAYRVFRDRYQRRWEIIDPIALHLGVTDRAIDFDLTVMPLIEGTDYREMVEFTQGAEISADDGHRSPEHLFHVVLGVNSDSEQIRTMGGFIRGMTSDGPKIRPLAWIGRYVELWMEPDEAWAQQVREHGSMPKDEDLFNVPIVAAVHVKNPLILTGFLTMIRGLATGAAPGMVVWETVENEGLPYVKVSATEEGRRMLGEEEFALCYATVGGHFFLTLREDLLRKTIERYRPQENGETAGAAGSGAPVDEATPVPAPARETWLGRHVGFEIGRNALTIFDALYRTEFLRNAQFTAWSNIPILNEWRRLYPESDAVALHEELWHVRLRCPSGAEYVWNERDQTFESPVYGHALAPKESEAFLSVFDGFTRGRFGLTFEHDGLRAKVRLER